MNSDRKFFVMGATLAAALAILAAGCGNSQDTPVASTTVGTEVDDTIITTRVKSALLADADIKSFDLKVETRKGVVQLSGFVKNQAQIDRAVATATGIPGVNSIENNVSLKAGNTTVGNKIDDGFITTQVKSALLADPSVKSFDIAVVTRNGEVQLSGFVDSQAQIDQAFNIARWVEGVTKVGNEMSIKQ